jgi:hypothetical protein
MPELPQVVQRLMHKKAPPVALSLDGQNLAPVIVGNDIRIGQLPPNASAETQKAEQKDPSASPEAPKPSLIERVREAIAKQAADGGFAYDPSLGMKDPGNAKIAQKVQAKAEARLAAQGIKIDPAKPDDEAYAALLEEEMAKLAKELSEQVAALSKNIPPENLAEAVGIAGVSELAQEYDAGLQLDYAGRKFGLKEYVNAQFAMELQRRHVPPDEEQKLKAQYEAEFRKSAKYEEPVKPDAGKPGGGEAKAEPPEDPAKTEFDQASQLIDQLYDLSEKLIAGEKKPSAETLELYAQLRIAKILLSNKDVTISPEARTLYFRSVLVKAQSYLDTKKGGKAGLLWSRGDPDPAKGRPQGAKYKELADFTKSKEGEAHISDPLIADVITQQIKLGISSPTLKPGERLEDYYRANLFNQKNFSDVIFTLYGDDILAHHPSPQNEKIRKTLLQKQEVIHSAGLDDDNCQTIRKQILESVVGKDDTEQRHKLDASMAEEIESYKNKHKDLMTKVKAMFGSYGGMILMAAYMKLTSLGSGVDDVEGAGQGQPHP